MKIHRQEVRELVIKDAGGNWAGSMVIPVNSQLIGDGADEFARHLRYLTETRYLAVEFTPDPGSVIQSIESVVIR